MTKTLNIKSKKSKTRIALFGGGRWARVLLDVCLKNTEQNIIFTVHTNHFIDDMKMWASKNGFENRIEVTGVEPNFLDLDYKAAIVANSAHSHKKSAELAIAARVPVLVEKPITPSFSETYSLIQSAINNDTHLSSSWVFLHAQYIDNFINRIGGREQIQKLWFDWTDESAEMRYGETKSYDSAIPVFKDVMPHVLSILSKIFKNQTFEFRSCKVSRGGSCVEITIIVLDVECCLRLERNSKKRRRKIVIKGQKDLQLDFAVEPGTISVDDYNFNGDLYWSISSSPLERMIIEFLKQTESDKFNYQNTNKLALSVSKLIEEIELAYNDSSEKWLIEHINQKEMNKEDINYFLSELVRVKFKVGYDNSDAEMIRYFDIIRKARLSKNFQKNTEVLNSRIVKFVRSLRDNKNHAS